MKNLYTLESIDRLINDCVENHGYIIQTCHDGILGYGKIVLTSPDDLHWNFIITEVPLNEWSSAHSVRKCRAISKSLQAEINAYYENTSE